MSVAIVGLAGCDRGPTAVPGESGSTIIPGTFGWDVEADSIVPADAPATDFSWEIVSADRKFLNPVHGTGAAIAKTRSYDEIDGEFLSHWRLPREPMAGIGDAGGLAAGTVVVFRTGSGTLGKLQVVGYRALHDLAFPAARTLEAEYRRQALDRENDQQYHIEIKWQLYRRKSG